jgi:hypothetical protein
MGYKFEVQGTKGYKVEISQSTHYPVSLICHFDDQEPKDLAVPTLYNPIPQVYLPYPSVFLCQIVLSQSTQSCCLVNYLIPLTCREDPVMVVVCHEVLVYPESVGNFQQSMHYQPFHPHLDVCHVPITKLYFLHQSL